LSVYSGSIARPQAVVPINRYNNHYQCIRFSKRFIVNHPVNGRRPNSNQRKLRSDEKALEGNQKQGREQPNSSSENVNQISAISGRYYLLVL